MSLGSFFHNIQLYPFLSETRQAFKIKGSFRGRTIMRNDSHFEILPKQAQDWFYRFEVTFHIPPALTIK